MPGGGIRTLMTTIAPRPLQGDDAQKYLWNMGFGFDAVLQKLDEGVHARFIGDAPESALQYIGSDRLVLRGLTESAESYRARLGRSIDDYQRAGNAWAVLSQVLGYVLADTPAALTVSSNTFVSGVPTRTVWNSYDAGADLAGQPTHTYDTTGNWDWDSVSPSDGWAGWWRWYLVLQSVAPNDWIGPAPKWGETGAKWGGVSHAWGVDRSANVGRSLKIIVGQWGSGVCHWIAVSFDASIFTPTGTPGVENPDGYYGRWSKIVGGVYVRARNSSARYFRGPTP